MKIGIDIDGTITTPFYWLDFFNKSFSTNLKPKNITTYDHHLAFNIKKKDFDICRSNHLEEIHHLAVPRNNAAFYINQLYFKQNNIHIITAREKILEPLTTNWLSKYHINYHRLYHLGSTEKVKLALKLHIDIFVEDRLETALELIQFKIPTILFNTPYNQGYNHPLLYRVNTWADAYRIIQDIPTRKAKSYGCS